LPRRRFENLTAWLLPFLLLRMLLPAGIMPVAGAQGVDFSICRGVVALDRSFVDEDTVPATSDAHGDQSCPFGLVVAGAAGDSAGSASLLRFVQSAGPDYALPDPVVAPAHRAHPPRAPPLAIQA